MVKIQNLTTFSRNIIITKPDIYFFPKTVRDKTDHPFRTQFIRTEIWAEIWASFYMCPPPPGDTHTQVGVHVSDIRVDT